MPNLDRSSTTRATNQPGAILFYTTKDPYGAFSNFAAYPIVICGVEWRTNEHYFQAQKFAGTSPLPRWPRAWAARESVRYGPTGRRSRTTSC